jgi:hypothetical protein
MIEKKIRVFVWGQQVDVDVEKRSATVWIARGEYNGKYYECKGRSAKTAAGAWKEAARYHNN